MSRDLCIFIRPLLQFEAQAQTSETDGDFSGPAAMLLPAVHGQFLDAAHIGQTGLFQGGHQILLRHIVGEAGVPE